MTTSSSSLLLQTFYSQVSSPLLRRITIQFPDDSVSDVTQNRFDKYFSGSELVVAGKVLPSDSSTLTSFTTASAVSITHTHPGIDNMFTIRSSEVSRPWVKGRSRTTSDLCLISSCRPAWTSPRRQKVTCRSWTWSWPSSSTHSQALPDNCGRTSPSNSCSLKGERLRSVEEISPRFLYHFYQKTFKCL